ncbi:hypothetical protein V8E53_014124 [Lactarius tabidus]
MPIYRSTHSRDAAVRARRKHVETGTWKRQCQHPIPTSRLRLPSLYFSRVSRIFRDAAVSRPELQRTIDECEADWVPPNVSPVLARLKLMGETRSLLREWETPNVLSLCYFSCTACTARPARYGSTRTKRQKQSYTGMYGPSLHFLGSDLVPLARRTRHSPHARDLAHVSVSRARLSLASYFVFVVRTFRNYGEVGPVVQRLADVTVGAVYNIERIFNYVNFTQYFESMYGHASQAAVSPFWAGQKGEK